VYSFNGRAVAALAQYKTQPTTNATTPAHRSSVATPILLSYRLLYGPDILPAEELAV